MKLNKLDRFTYHPIYVGVAIFLCTAVFFIVLPNNPIFVIVCYVLQLPWAISGIKNGIFKNHTWKMITDDGRDDWNQRYR